MSDMAISELVSVGEYVSVIRREKWRALGVAAVVAAGATALALVWPPTYRSTATILIEQADIPADLVTSTVSAIASDRIQAIQQRIITTANLSKIIDKYNLYAEVRESSPLNEVAEGMRANIKLALLSADAGTRGRGNEAAIAFTLSFDGSTPSTTHQVTTELAALFLSESERDSFDRATDATSFLQAEAVRLNADVETLELKLEEFRRQHAGQLPEDRLFNVQLLDRADSQLLDLSRQIQSLRERQGAVRAQLAGTATQLAMSGDRTELSPAEQAALLQAKRAEMSARYGPKHPEVMALDRQINALRSVGVFGGDVSDLRVQTLQSDLTVARQRYGTKHPDTVRLERELQAAQAAAAAAPQPAPVPQSNVTNPAFLQLQAELSSLNGELQAVIAQQQATEEKRANMEARILQAPGVERDYISLKREYDTAVAKYLDIRTKEAAAELSKSLETQRMGEKLTLIEPAAEPIAPIKPNRPVMIAIGLLAAIAAGVVVGILHDAMEQRVHGWRRLREIVGQAPMAVIPVIQTTSDRRRASQARRMLIFLGALIGGAVLVSVHLFVTPLVSWSPGQIPVSTAPSIVEQQSTRY
jgi:polysaccharide biosynthesis transport protein